MLTDTAVKNIKSTPPRKISDANGHYLEVTATRSKLWRMAYRFAVEGSDKKKQRTLYIDGAYPAVRLADVRAIGAAARALIKKGIDPNSHKQQVVRDSGGGKESFAKLAGQWHADMLATTKRKPKAESTLNRIKDHKDLLIAKLGHLDATAIKSSNVLEVLKPYRVLGQMHQARRVRSCASWIFQWGMAIDLYENNPAVSIPKEMLKSAETVNRPALTDPTAFGKLLRDIDAYDTTKYSNVTGLALQLLPLLDGADHARRRAEERILAVDTDH